jgi:hypothetical protein
MLLAGYFIKEFIRLKRYYTLILTIWIGFLKAQEVLSLLV